MRTNGENDDEDATMLLFSRWLKVMMLSIKGSYDASMQIDIRGQKPSDYQRIHFVIHAEQVA